MKIFQSPKMILLPILSVLPFLNLEARSWQEICASRKLRVLAVDVNRETCGGHDGLHRIVMPIDREQALLRSFVRRHGLTIEYMYVSRFSQLFHLLKEGKGDLISANLSETENRKKNYLLSIPFEYTREIVFTASGSPIRGSGPSCLIGKTGRLLPGTSYAENFRRRTAGMKGILVRDLPATISHDDLLENVEAGTIAYSVLNESDLDAWLAYRPGIRKLFSVRDRVPLVFAAEKRSGELIRHLNQFIAEVKNLSPGKSGTGKSPAAGKLSDRFSGDLAAIRKRGYVRMLTCNNLFCCYIHRGQLCGFEYELAKRFADSIGVALVTVIPENFQDLTRYLQEGRGDFIAANFARTPARIRRFPDLSFGPAYCEIRQILAGRLSEKVTSLHQLNGRKIHVLKGKSHMDTLRQFRAAGYTFTIVPISQEESSMQTLRKVASGEYDLAAVDDTYLKIAVAEGCKVKQLFPLTEKESFTWAIRKSNPKLLAAVNAFFKKENKGVFFNLCKHRYYSPKYHSPGSEKNFSKNQKNISPYDALFRKYGRIYGFNWCLLAAQSYQESRFKPDRVNHIGAAGLMQVMPETARELGISNLTNPDNGVRAGTKYLHRLRERFPEAATSQDQICFALASYNAGYGHVKDARKLAVRLGLNPRKWFRNTEKALALLEEPRYASRAQFGYCRASETIPYVTNIAAHAYLYRRIMEGKEPVFQTLQTPQGPQPPKKRLNTR